MEAVEEVQNRRKILKLADGGEEDRISKLPESLLVEILSRLPSTKDAIRTGALSKRWIHLWTLVTTLIFTHIESDDIRLKNPNVRSDFFSFVDKALTQCRQLKLMKFELCTSYDCRFESQVNNWIRYAISCNVEEFKLTFCYSAGFKGSFLFDQSFFIGSCFTDLTFGGCQLNPSGAISWKNLKKLCFSHVRLNEELIENILSGSPLLETLELVICCGFRRLDITSKSVKNLVFSGFSDPRYFLGEEIVEINAPNILSLTIQNNVLLWTLWLLNVSSLVEAYLDYKKYGCWDETDNLTEEQMLEGLILNLRHVKELKIGDSCSKVLSRLKAQGFEFPSNMKFFGDWCDNESENYSEHESESENYSEHEHESESESENYSEHEGEGESESESESNTDSEGA